jgi:hypothetical protein
VMKFPLGDETRPKKAISYILYHIVSNFKESLIPVIMKLLTRNDTRPKKVISDILYHIV